MTEYVSTFARTITRTVELPYMLTLPRGYDASADPWPLILFLHGAGERGTDVNRLRVYGMPKIAASEPDFPFITVSPVCPENRWWMDYLDVLRDLLADIQARYTVDASRIYLTGLSMGGFGAWHMAVEYPDLFAAVAPICGGGVWAYGMPERVRDIKHVPVWAFHGAKDAVVPVESSQVMVDALEAAGGDVRFTIYPEAEHDSWTAAYDNPDLYTWFLSHRQDGAALFAPGTGR